MKWTEELCKTEALKYKNRWTFRQKSGGCYMFARKNNILDDICSHMINTKNPHDYWTKERCHEKALEYNNYSEFIKNCVTIYKKCIKNDWLKDICSHMTRNENNSKRCVYVYIFIDNSVYVGLTNNLKRRNHQHLITPKDAIHSKIKDNVKYELIQVTDYIDVNSSILEEDNYVKKYKAMGYVILNKIKTGGIGGYNKDKIKRMYWTKERCQEKALKYNSRNDFQRNCQSAYSSAFKNKWLNEVCSHMSGGKKPDGYWNKEHCQEEALKYKNKHQLQKYCSGAYMSAYKNNWLNELKFNINTNACL